MHKIFTRNKGWLRAILSLIFLVCAVTPSWAQTKVITGTVSETNGATLVGVTVQVKGTNIYVNTDVKGAFKINLPATNNTLVFKYVGFNDKEVVVGVYTALKVTLTEKVSTLDDVVVIGYGTVARKDLTGAVGSVSMKD
jgi:hypothetical protein